MLQKYFFQKVFSKEDKSEVEGKNKIAGEILDMLSHVSSEIGKSHWVKKLAEELQTTESVLTDMLKKVTLKSRTNENHQSEKEENTEFSAKTKMEILVDDLLGLMLIHESVWRKAFVEEKGNPNLLKDKLLSAMLEQGEKIQFKFDNLLKELDNPAEVSRAEKIYFEKKYRPDLNNNIEEIISENPTNDYLNCVREIKKEVKRKELARIEKDLKIAEANGDREAILFLREEVKKISGELIN